MIKSMTGFGRSEYNDGKRNIIVEIKSVNHRYNDISVRMPKKYSFAEEKIKGAIKNTIKRGKVDVSIIIENLTDNDSSVELNTDLARQYFKNLKVLNDEFKLNQEISISLLASMPDVLKLRPSINDESEILNSMLIPAEAAAGKLNSMRCMEGEKLAEDINSRGEMIIELVEKIETRAPNVVCEYKEKLRERINELLGEHTSLDEERLALETAVFADKCSIAEELVRLDSHIHQLQKNVHGNGPAGRKLDFLVQEMNREINTIGSKANDLEITNLVVEIKSEIEKIREQIQNIE